MEYRVYSKLSHSDIVSTDQVSEILIRARDERWSHLALINDFSPPQYSQDVVRSGWPESHVFRCEESLTVSQLHCITAMEELRSLDLSYNNIGPGGAAMLACMAGLVELDLEGSGIADMGVDALVSLPNLTRLNLRLNSIGDQGARALAPLTKLTSLKLGYNQIGDEGARVFSQLLDLEELELEVNRFGLSGIQVLPVLKNLSKLKLGGAAIGPKGAEVLASLTSLTRLVLHASKIGSEGARCLVSLRNLTSLDLVGNAIGNEGADAISCLGSLTDLNLAGNGLGNTGARSLIPLTNLTSLNLANNEIGVDGAIALTSLENLTRLDLQGNSIGDDGAIALSSLSKLHRLDLGCNGIGDTGTRSLQNLTQLTSLNLGYNKIGNSGAQTLASLLNLTSLLLMGNGIGDGGVSNLSRLTKLKLLNLSKCQLSRFPKQILDLPELKVLCLFGNPILDLPSELLGHGQYDNCHRAVRAHFSDIELGAEADRELKLIILGNGRVGKTSIIRFLMNEPFNPNEDSTHAIQLRYWNQTVGSQSVRINIWDFGGQDIYFNTHTLFLKSRAIFLIVWDKDAERQSHWVDERGRKFEIRPLQYWIDFVRTVSPGSQVIVVQNKCDDGGGTEIPADLKGIEHVSFSALDPSHKGEALIGLIRGAASIALRNPGASLIGKGRWRVKQTIRSWQDEDDKRPPGEARRHQMLELDRFVALCDEEPGAVTSSDLLLEFLHNTGVVYYQSHFFQNQIILDQRWAIEAIYTLFDRNTCYDELRERTGRFTQANLKRLCWDQQGFTAEEQRLFLSFMVSCAICFPVGGTDSEPIYLAPQLLPERKDLPASVREQINDRLASVDRSSPLYYRYEYRFLHGGIMQRFMARIGLLYRDSTIFWRNGVLLKAQTPHAVAEVSCHHNIDSDPTRGEIVFSVWGDGKDTLLTQLRRQFAQLRGSDQEIKESGSRDGTTWVNQDDLRRFEPVGSVADAKVHDLQSFLLDPDSYLMGEFLTLGTEAEDRIDSAIPNEAGQDFSIDNECREQILVGEVTSIVAGAGHIFRPISNSDHGIDGEIEYKDDRGCASGKRLYLQLRSGDSHLQNLRDGREKFVIKKLRWIKYWQQHAYPVMLVIRSSTGVIRWMDLSSCLKQASARGRITNRIEFKGETFDIQSVRQWRDRSLKDF